MWIVKQRQQVHRTLLSCPTPEIRYRRIAQKYPRNPNNSNSFSHYTDNVLLQNTKRRIINRLKYKKYYKQLITEKYVISYSNSNADRVRIYGIYNVKIRCRIFKLIKYLKMHGLVRCRFIRLKNIFINFYISIVIIKIIQIFIEINIYI